jgi:hypothetical protein
LDFFSCLLLLGEVLLPSICGQCSMLLQCLTFYFFVLEPAFWLSTYIRA